MRQASCLLLICIGLGFLVVDSISAQCDVTVPYIGVLYQDRYHTLIIPLNNSLANPLIVHKVSASFDWAPQISYAAKGHSTIVEARTVQRFQVEVYVPKQAAANEIHECAFEIVCSEQIAPNVLREIEISFAHKFLVLESPDPTSKEITKTITAEITKQDTKTIMIEKPEGSALWDSLKWGTGIGLTILFAFLGIYFGSYLPTQIGTTELKLKGVYSPLYEILRRAQKDNGQRTAARQIPPPRNFALEVSEFKRLQDIIENSGYQMPLQMRRKLSVDLGKRDNVTVNGHEYYRFSARDMSDSWMHIWREHDRLSGELDILRKRAARFPIVGNRYRRPPSH
jgi:hypothetical protein